MCVCVCVSVEAGWLWGGGGVGVGWGLSRVNESKLNTRSCHLVWQNTTPPPHCVPNDGGVDFFLACEDFGRMFDHSFPDCFFFLKRRSAWAH